MQNRMIRRTLSATDKLPPPLPLRAIAHSRWLRGLFASAVGIGVRPELPTTVDR